MTTEQTTVVLDGTAVDELGIVTAVLWSIDHGASGPCRSISEWTTGPIPLTDGINLITVTAQDGMQNAESAILSVTYTGSEPPEASSQEPPSNDGMNPPPSESPDTPPAGMADDSDSAGSADGDSELDGETKPVDSPPTESEVPESYDGWAPNGDDAIHMTPPRRLCGAVALSSLPMLLLSLCALRRRTA